MLRFSTAFSVPGTGWGAAMQWEGGGWVGALMGSRSHQMPPEHVCSLFLDLLGGAVHRSSPGSAHL